MSLDLHLDGETYSTVDLTRTGTYPYFESPTTGVHMLCYAFDDEDVETWWPDDFLCPPRIVDHVRSGGRVWAHNAMFERLLWWGILTPRYGWPRPAREQFRCTAAMAAALALPRSLDGAARAMSLEQRKDEEGSKLMRRMMKPYRIINGEPQWWHQLHPEDLPRLGTYCAQDVRTERAFHKVVFPLSELEQRVYVFDQRVNDRGVKLDLETIIPAQDIVEAQSGKLSQSIRTATGWRVMAPTQRGAIIEWCASQGVDIPSLAKKKLADTLRDPTLPSEVKDVLLIRQEAAKSSTAKLVSMQEYACRDGRARGMYLYCGASTWRWAGKGPQPHNFVRGSGTVDEPEEAIEYLRSGNAAMIEALFGPPLNVVSDCLRSMLMADEGKELVAADLANIEGRQNAWLAGERWKLRAFSDVDAGIGDDLYKVTAAGISGKLIKDITKDERQALGKVPELALGFGGGVNAFYSMSLNYPGTDTAVFNAYPHLWSSAAPEMREKVERAHRIATGPAAAMPWEWWAAADVIKRNWRNQHLAIANMWAQLDDAAIMAVENPGVPVECGKIRFIRRYGFLWMLLPSGRSLAYAAPEIRWQDAPWADKTLPAAQRDKVKFVSFLGVKGKNFIRQGLYGGLLDENAVQAISRDVLATNMLTLDEDLGYPIVMHTHDEGVAEVPIGYGDLAEFERTLATVPGWNVGCPIVAKGWRGQRYRKD